MRRVIEWVKCSDRLPKDGWYFVCQEFDCGGYYYSVLDCCQGHWNSHVEPDGKLYTEYESKNVIAWAEIVPFEDKE